jgi:hypothetical protein
MGKKGKFKKISIKETSRLQIKEKPPNYDTFKPIFSFRHMEYRGKCCLSSCEKLVRADVVDTLLQLSQIPWSEILSTQRKGIGKENIPVRQFKVKLPQFVTEDVEKLMVFHFSEAGRMAGIRRNDIYHVLVVGYKLYDH